MSSGKVLPFFALLFASLSVHATSFMPRPLDDAIQDTPVIVRGKIGNQFTDWVQAGGSKTIQTFFQLNIDEVFKGPVEGTSLVFRQMGGEKDGVGLSVPGSADFQPGEDVVVMLSNPNPDGSFDLMGLSTGKYVIERNSDGKEVLIGAGTQDPPHLAHKNSDTQHGGMDEDNEHPGTADQSRWSLDAFRQAVRETGLGKTLVSNSARPNVAPSNSPKAPQLQPAAKAESFESEEKGQDFSSRKGIGIGIILLGAAFVILYWRGKRKD